MWQRKCMLIHSCCRRSLSPLDVQLNGTHIQQVQNYKYLGVVISDTLSWSQHIDFVCSKAAKGIGLLCWLSWFLPRQALCMIYNTYILPHLTYADAVWGLAHKGKAEVWSTSRIMLPASSSADVWVHLLLTCGGNWTGPHWLLEGLWVKLWQFTKVSLVVALPICLQEPIKMPPGPPPTEASVSLKWGPNLERRHLLS